MPANNVKCVCQLCQRNEFIIPAMDVTSMTFGEIIDAVMPTINKAGWSVRPHYDKRIGRYLVCPACVAAEAKSVGALAGYDETTACPKCGAPDMLTTWRHGLEGLSLVPVEHMERECKRCKYKMPQKPL